MMRKQEPIIRCDCGCDVPMKPPLGWWQLSALSILAGIAMVGLVALLSACDVPKADPQLLAQAEQERTVTCRAKFANFLMRFEELSKPERERWEAFTQYMGPSCLR